MPKAKPRGKSTKKAPARRARARATPPTRKPAAATRSAGRLGDDGVPLSREPRSLIVARTDIVAGKVRIVREAAALDVARGQLVHVKHPYRLQEHSGEREEYRFLLKTRLDGVDHPPSLARLGDQWGVPEDISGYLQHEYTFTRPGLHTIEFEVGAEYTVMAWGDTDVKHLDRKDLKGSVDVRVT